MFWPQRMFMVHGICSAAVKRLIQLLSIKKRAHQGISHEHIAVHCGNDSDILQILVEADISMIQQNEKKIGAFIRRIIKQTVPEAKPPSHGVPSTDLESEILDFVTSYISKLLLLNFLYHDIPLLSAKSPSSLVPPRCLLGEATKEEDCAIKTNSYMTHSTRRLLEYAEREKREHSKILVVST
jgi:hypothetical protein